MRQFANLENLDELKTSILQCGIINPITIRPLENGQYEIVAGIRRFLAAQSAGLTQIPCVIMNTTDLDSDKIKIHENIFREDINPVDEGKFYSHLQEKYKLTISDLSRLTRKSESYIYERIKILNADEKILAALEAEHIKLSVAEELAKISDEKTRQYYLTLAIEQGITSNTARTWRINWEIEIGLKSPPIMPTTEQKKEIEKAIFTDSCLVCRCAIELHLRRVIVVCPSCHDLILSPPQK